MKRVANDIIISADLDFDGSFKEKMLERERALRPLFHRPAYQGTELEKCSASFLNDIKNRNVD